MHLISPKPESASSRDDALIRRARPLLGTLVEIALDAESTKLFDVAFDAIAHIHSRMSFHESGSDINAIARARPGELIELDRHTVNVLRLAADLHRRSRGLFDITVGKALVKSGFLPLQGEEPLSHYDGNARDIDIISDTEICVRRPVLIDLGGIAKGYAVDHAVDRLQAAGAKFGIVNAGGDLRSFGDHAADIDIRQTNGELSVCQLRESSVASSENRHARRYRFWTLQTPHIGPGGKSVRIDETVSVVANQCAVADALTKVAMIDVALASKIASDYDGFVVGESRGNSERIPMNRRTARLAQWQTRMLSGSGIVLWMSGALWLLLHYFVQVDGEFGPQSHPLESWLLRAHGLALIPALLAVGGLFVAHMPIGWDNRSQRRTGTVLAAILSVLIVSGYLLYYVGTPQLREWSSVIHWVIGLAVPILFVWHRLKPGSTRNGSQ